MPFPPLSILKEAVKAVPAVKYALGIAGVASVIAIVAGLKIDFRVAIFGTIILIGLMFLLLIFSYTASPKNKKALRLPSLVLAWSVIGLTIFSTTMLTSSFFFRWPLDMAVFFHKSPAGTAIIISGSIRTAARQPVSDAQISIDGVNFVTRSNETGKFMAALNGVGIGEIITLRVYHEQFQSVSITRQLARPEESFTLTLQPR